MHGRLNTCYDAEMKRIPRRMELSARVIIDGPTRHKKCPVRNKIGEMNTNVFRYVFVDSYIFDKSMLCHLWKIKSVKHLDGMTICIPT